MQDPSSYLYVLELQLQSVGELASCHQMGVLRHGNPSDHDVLQEDDRHPLPVLDPALLGEHALERV